MANFTPFTQTQDSGITYKPVPADLIYRSAATQYDRGMQNIAQAQASYDNIFKIPSLPGKDTEVLKQKEQAYLAEMQKIAQMGSPSDVALNSKMRTFLQQASNDPDILAVAQRGHAYQNELSTKKDYESKGKQYVSPLLRDAEKYINSGVYLKDKRFNRQGFVAPDNKELDEIAKNTPEWETWITKGRYDIHQKGKAESSLANNYLTHFKNNPQWSQLLNDQFEQQIEGLDLNQAIANPTQAVAQLLPYLPESERQEAINTLTEVQLLGDNPYLQTAIKDKLRNDYFNNQAYMAAQAKTYVNTVDKKANEFSKMAVDHQYNLAEIEQREKQKNQYKQVAGNIKIDPVRRARLTKAATELGTDISDPSQPDGYISNEALDDLGILKAPKTTKEQEKEAIREDVSSIRDLYRANPEKIKEALKSKVGGLGVMFGEDDIESVEWNKDTNRYEVVVDDGGYGTSTTSFTQEEMDALKTSTSVKEPTIGYSNLTKAKDSKGNVITIGIKDGKWYNTENGELIE